ncbi:MFS transporter [Teredinibacter turnerae]|uniref:MFS transporter n=1 Tax=Teredinibacter turnerae TaxID=2426 RepID=UPI0003F6AC49|nr:MFS transporter [Teredinibacter turnerae]
MNPTPQTYLNRTRHWITLVALIIAGEIIFALPFHIARFFRPTFLDAFSLNNAELGDIFALYGVTAMLAYFPGGPLADRFSARTLITIALLTTALGGLVLVQMPGKNTLALLFAYWGITTILLFWAAMIKATRLWGGDNAQGIAFGLLDGGRGLVAAGVASLAVSLFVFLLPATSLPGADEHTLTHAERVESIQTIITYYTTLTFAAAVLTWFALPVDNKEYEQPHQQFSAYRTISSQIRNPLIWLQGLIVVCAYCCYKGIDNYGLYAYHVLDMSESDAAQFTASAAYLRPIGAVLAGLLADRAKPAKVIFICFCLIAVCYATLSLPDTASFIPLAVINLAASALAVFAVRGIYFALIHQSGLAKYATGTAAGLVSVLGFTPDIFFAPIAGRILDAEPIEAAHQAYFVMLQGFAVGGALITLFYQHWLTTKNDSELQNSLTEGEKLTSKKTAKI